MLRIAALVLACCAPLFLGACRDNADPVKPKVAQAAPLPASA
jgi:hypothetical protein